MKVSGPRKSSATSGVSKTKKSDKVAATDESFGNMIVGETQSASDIVGASPTQNIAQVDALLAVQGAESATERGSKRQLHKRGVDILHALENIRMAMLSGNLTVGHMIDIADVVASHRETVDDPQLTALIDEIDLRAQVELAKMRVVFDKKVT